MILQENYKHHKCAVAKGHLISKCLYGVFKFFQKKLTKTSGPKVHIIVIKSIFFSFVFWKNWGCQKVILKLTDL